jgi:hypothetical protein
MRRWLWAASASILALASSPVQAGGWHDFWHGIHVDCYRNNSWPEPFLTADRNLAREPFCIQVDNGWKVQNTIGSMLFNPETQQLNQAGDLLVRWIVTQAPIHRRAVFVVKGDNADITRARVDSVNAAVARWAGGPVCPVMLTTTEPTGWPASYVDSITQQFNSTIPSPRLPGGDGDGGGGGGGGGSGGAPSQ